MLNNHKLEKISFEELAAFFMTKGYIGDMEMLGDIKESIEKNLDGKITLYDKTKRNKITFPYVSNFTIGQIKILLSKTDLSIDEFEEYIESLQK